MPPSSLHSLPQHNSTLSQPNQDAWFLTRVWSRVLEQDYEKVIFLDADILLLDNVSSACQQLHVLLVRERTCDSDAYPHL